MLPTAIPKPITDYHLIQAFDIGTVWYPDYAAYRRTDGFKRLATALGLPVYWGRRGFPLQCRPVGQTDFECH